ncbi:MAG: quinolinate synthase NadA [Firmicutes bacterium]|jgi:quinolinate synthase|nr:quinolinate synthase NadA [Bacillota bacterium]
MASMVLAEIKEKIAALKEERKAVILAHNYQVAEVQELADHTGDSFELSRIAAESEAEVIVFCGVHFMAESAAILAPDKIVLLPEAVAGCPMADMVAPEELRQWKEKYPDAAVVVYINSSAAVKAESDICATSANAAAVVNSLHARRVIFAPDRNLAHFVSRHTDKEIIAWPGYCITHHRITPQDIERARRAHPGAPVIVHPECRPEVVEMADAVLGTGGMIRYVRETEATEIIVGTEAGMIYRLRKERPEIKFYVPGTGLVCPNMKYTTPEKVLSALEKMQHRVTVAPEIRERAAEALRRMLAVPSA